MKRIPQILIVIAILVLTSCVPLKDFVYLYGIEETEKKLQTTDLPQYLIQPDDNLFIQIISNDELSKYFNLSSTDRYLNNDAAIEIGSYKVSNDGEICLPYLGMIKVAGLTIEEIKSIIDKGISQLLVQYSVVVKLVNRGFTLLGEINSPGTYSFYKDYLTIFEAIGYGKDFTDYANYHKVTIIRRTNKGELIKKLDLTKKDIICSDFYFIQPRDIIYVEPRDKIWGTKTLPFATILTAINTSILLYNSVSYAIR